MRRSAGGLCVFVVLLMCAVPAVAQQDLEGGAPGIDAERGKPNTYEAIPVGPFLFTPAIQLNYQYRDNIFFTPDDPRAEIFKDPRVWSREFEILGRKRAENEIEIIHLHGVEEDQLIRLYYRCDVCSIDAYAPGLCWCCQEEFEFRAVPVEAAPN